MGDSIGENGEIMLSNPSLFYPLLDPLHSGYPEQLQNSLPAFTPFLAIRLIIGLPHLGQVGALDWMLCSAR